MDKAPESYLSCRRPSILEAIRMEGDITIGDAMELLEKKGYFTPRPRPWKLGYKDRGLGRLDFVVLDCFGDLVTEVLSRSDAELIISAVNATSITKKAIKALEDEATQLEIWASETRVPRGLMTRLGDEMTAQARGLRTYADSLKVHAD